jgi:sepiapterin reductase
VQPVDLGDKADYVPKTDALVTQLQAGKYARVLLVHNAGSLGDLGFTHEWSSPEALTAYWEFNLTSVCWFNKRFLDAFGGSRAELLAADEASASRTKSVIVNITSLCGIKALATYGVYCTGKAAREMHHGVIAAEQAPAGLVRVLSYSPGPMDTGMQEVFRESPLVHPDLAKTYVKMKAEGTLVDPSQSANRGVRLALSGTFESGAHVDYYDLDHLDAK